MTMVHDAPEVTLETEAGDGPPPRDERPIPAEDRWWARLPTLLVVALAVLVGVAAVLVHRQNQDLQAGEDDRREAAQVAGDFTTAVLSYDHRDLGGSLDRVVALSTPDWGRQYEDAWFSEQQGVIEELQAVARVDVRDVLLGEEHDGTVPAVVVFNADIDSQIGTRRLGGSYLRLDLVRHEGDWRVDNLQFLAATDQRLDPAEGNGQQGGQPGQQGGQQEAPPAEPGG